MNKKWKITIAIVLALMLGAGAYLAYIFKFKQYDVADDEVAQIVEDPYEVELPDGSKLVIGEDGTVDVQDEPDDNVGDDKSKQESGNDSSESSDGSSDNAVVGITPPGGSSTSSSENKGSTSVEKPGSTKKMTVAEVKGKYEPVFRGLEAQADTKINSLIGRAKKEYSDKKAKGESIDFGYFYNKYMGAATNLEANTDAVFYGVITAVEAELVANGFNKSYAKSFIDEYEATKKARRDGILKKAVGRE